MPQKKAAFKSLRQSQKRHDRHGLLRKKIKDLKKKVEKAVMAEKASDAQSLLKELQKAVDKASKAGGYMHKNTASRVKERMQKKIQSLTKKK